MEKFILTSKMNVLNDEQINVCLFPEHYFLNDKIETCFVISAKQDINSQITDAITMFTPILFEEVQNMENIPSFIKENIEL